MEDVIIVKDPSPLVFTGDGRGGDIVFCSGKGGLTKLSGMRGPDGAIRFKVGGDGGVEVLTLDHEGMVYMGKRVTDAGEAHAAVLAMVASMFQGTV